MLGLNHQPKPSLVSNSLTDVAAAAVFSQKSCHSPDLTLMTDALRDVYYAFAGGAVFRDLLMLPHRYFAPS